MLSLVVFQGRLDRVLAKDTALSGLPITMKLPKIRNIPAPIEGWQRRGDYLISGMPSVGSITTVLPTLNL